MMQLLNTQFDSGCQLECNNEKFRSFRSSFFVLKDMKRSLVSILNNVCNMINLCT